MPFTLAKLEEIEAHLGNNPYLSEGGLPAAEDARIFVELNYGIYAIIQPPQMSPKLLISIIGSIS